jgi:hypothetical protein
LNTETDSKCRLWQQFDETIDHIISACPILAKEQYIKRHDRECTTTLQHMQENRDTIGQKHWYEHVPKSVEKSKEVILWNQQLQTDRTIPNNKPHIIIRDNKNRTYMLIDVAI